MQRRAAGGAGAGRVARPGGGLVVTGWDRYLAENGWRQNLYGGMDLRVAEINGLRDILEDIVGGPLVLVVGEAFLKVMASRMPDVLSFSGFRGFF